MLATQFLSRDLLRWSRLSLFILILGLSCCCSLHLPQKCQSDIDSENHPEVFQTLLRTQFKLVWPDDSGRHPVYLCTTAPEDGDTAAAERRPVLVLHEYDHLSTACLQFAQRLSQAGFRVYVPLLFGKADGQSGTWTTIANTLSITTNGEWHALFGEHQKQPITGWLLDLAKRISEKHGGRGIAVIGMCLTGSLPIALIGENAPIASAVVAQPSIPLFACTPEGKRAPGISQDELNKAVERAHAEHIRIFGTRYEKDQIGKAERFEAIRKAFGDNFEDHTIHASDYLPKDGPDWGLKPNAHATLTFCYRPGPDDYPPRKLFLELVIFLRQQFQTKNGEHS